MPNPIHEFWKLAVASGLFAPAAAQQLHAAFAGLKGAAQQANPASLAEWLIAQGKLTRYQASVLLAGHPGPFVFGDFVLCERIESGRLAQVFRAKYKGTRGALVMFAAQLPHAETDPDLVVEQTRTAIAIKSPHVNRVHQFVAHQALPFIVIEDLKGESLREFLAGQKPTFEMACHIGFQAALGLAEIHAQHAVHGNLCPENLWIDPSSHTVKLLQFPLACAVNEAERLRPPSIDYLAPELAMPERVADALTDIYALGCILYELIAGRVPFPGGSAEQKLPRHQREIPQRLDALISSVPEEVADLVAEMLDKEPWLRAQTASHVAHLLAPFVSGTPPRTARPPKREHTPLALAVEPAPDSDWEPSFVVRNAATTELAAKPKRRISNTTLIGVGVAVGLVAAIVVAGLALSGDDSAVATTRPGPPAGVSASGTAGDVAEDGNSQAGQAETDSEANAEGGAPRAAPPAASAPAASAAPTVQEFKEIDDDGQTLWTSPTAGEPLTLDYAPPGAQLFLVLRPAEILADPEGTKLFDSLGPAGQWARANCGPIWVWSWPTSSNSRSPS